MGRRGHSTGKHCLPHIEEMMPTTQMRYSTVGPLWALQWCFPGFDVQVHTRMHVNLWVCGSTHACAHISPQAYNRVTVMLETSGLLKWMREAYHQDYVSRIRKMCIALISSACLSKGEFESHLMSAAQAEHISKELRERQKALGPYHQKKNALWRCHKGTFL